MIDAPTTSSPITLRPYQTEAVAAVYDHLRLRDDNPCVVIPTAGDKAPVMAAICRDAVQKWNGRVLILAHVKELLEQAVEKLHVMAPDLWMQIGVYSAGLKSRDTETLKRFKDGDLKYLVNVNVLTTGFDAPNIDCVVLLRPTNSPGLFYQMVGRGFRLHSSKENCLVLDFGGNILRHGPVDDLQIKESDQGDGEAPAKECPECQEVIHAAYATCPECGHEFPPCENCGKHPSGSCRIRCCSSG